MTELYALGLDDTHRIKKMLEAFEAGRLEPNAPYDYMRGTAPIETYIVQVTDGSGIMGYKHGCLGSGEITLSQYVDGMGSGCDQVGDAQGIKMTAYNLYPWKIEAGDFVPMVRDAYTGKYFLMPGVNMGCGLALTDSGQATVDLCAIAGYGLVVGLGSGSGCCDDITGSGSGSGCCKINIDVAYDSEKIYDIVTAATLSLSGCHVVLNTVKTPFHFKRNKIGLLIDVTTDDAFTTKSTFNICSCECTGSGSGCCPAVENLCVTFGTCTGAMSPLTGVTVTLPYNLAGDIYQDSSYSTGGTTYNIFITCRGDNVWTLTVQLQSGPQTGCSATGEGTASCDPISAGFGGFTYTCGGPGLDYTIESAIAEPCASFRMAEAALPPLYGWNSQGVRFTVRQAGIAWRGVHPVHGLVSLVPSEWGRDWKLVVRNKTYLPVGFFKRPINATFQLPDGEELWFTEMNPDEL